MAVLTRAGFFLGGDLKESVKRQKTIMDFNQSADKYK